MLERIKAMLKIDIADTSKDAEIGLNIELLSEMVLEVCNRKVLTKALQSFIVIKICGFMESKISNNNSNTSTEKEVKAITRGDTKIEYNTSSSSGNSINAGFGKTIALTESDREFLKGFKKVKVY